MCIKSDPFFYVFFYLVYIQALDIREYAIDVGNNLTLQCPYQQSGDIMWIREGREQRYSHLTITEEGSLFLENVAKNDSGLYSCRRENVVNDEKALIKVAVRTPPPALVNVSVHPSTILALILWKVQGTGGYPILNFTAQYRLAYTTHNWTAISPNHITPNARQIDVYKLHPNTTYEFRLWATNQLGRGEIAHVTATTLKVYTEQELARHLLAGAEQFDTRVWAIAVGIVMGTLFLLGFGTCFLLYQECNYTNGIQEQEIIELVPNIILNPGFEGQARTPDENSNNETFTRLNNNCVVQPRREM